MLGDVDARDRRAAGRGLEQRGEDADGGGLAGAVGPEQAVDGAVGDGEVDAVDGLDVAEVLDEAVGDDRVIGGHAVSLPWGYDGRERVAVRAGAEAAYPDPAG